MARLAMASGARRPLPLLCTIEHVQDSTADATHLRARRPWHRPPSQLTGRRCRRLGLWGPWTWLRGTARRPTTLGSQDRGKLCPREHAATCADGPVLWPELSAIADASGLVLSVAVAQWEHPHGALAQIRQTSEGREDPPLRMRTRCCRPSAARAARRERAKASSALLRSGRRGGAARGAGQANRIPAVLSFAHEPRPGARLAAAALGAGTLGAPGAASCVARRAAPRGGGGGCAGTGAIAGRRSRRRGRGPARTSAGAAEHRLCP